MLSQICRTKTCRIKHAKKAELNNRNMHNKNIQNQKEWKKNQIQTMKIINHAESKHFQNQKLINLQNRNFYFT